MVHQVGLADRGRVAEREHLHLLDEAPPDDQVVAVEPERERLAVQDLLADEVGKEPVRLGGRRRPSPLPLQVLVEPVALGRGHHDVVARPRGALEPERDLLVLGLVMVMSHGSRSLSRHGRADHRGPGRDPWGTAPGPPVWPRHQISADPAGGRSTSSTARRALIATDRGRGALGLGCRHPRAPGAPGAPDAARSADTARAPDAAGPDRASDATRPAWTTWAAYTTWAARSADATGPCRSWFTDPGHDSPPCRVGPHVPGRGVAVGWVRASMDRLRRRARR